jgi:hypothetical protein
MCGHEKIAVTKSTLRAGYEVLTTAIMNNFIFQDAVP